MDAATALRSLAPRPRDLRAPGERCRFPRGLAPGAAPGPRTEAAALRLPGVRAGVGGAPLDLAADGADLPPEGYELSVGPAGVRVRGADEAGVFRGLCTLAQLLSAVEPGGALELPGLVARDWPDFPVRAVSLDVNRDKVPTMATLFALVDRLAAWKVNQLQLYMEHVFAYRGHEEVWRDASPFTGDELRALDRHCRERFVELVPNQNSLAHFHRWLVHPRYAPLAEVPEGVVHPFSHAPEPFSLCPTDERSYALLADLYDQLLPCFESRLFHVGLDEPIDLGLGRSAAAARERGAGRLFLDHLLRVHAMVRERGRTMMFWADWILLHEDLVPELPDDLIACAWGYEADHPFERELETLARAVPRRYVCPGTSAWNSACGRTSNALANLLRASRAGRRFGCEGYLVADWGDHGHWQPLPISWPGFLFGACAAWNGSDVPSPAELAHLLDVHALRDPAGAAGRALLALGDAHAAAGARCINGSAPFFLLHFAHAELPHPRLEGVDAAGLERVLAALDGAAGRLADARLAGTEGALVRRELDLAADVARAGCRLGLARLAAGGAPCAALAADVRRALAAELRALAERHREVWLARNRPGGLAASAGRFERIARLLEGA